MIRLLHWKTIGYFIIGLTIVIATASYMLNEPEGILEFFKLFGSVGLVFTALVIGLGESPLFPILCKKSPLNKIFPDIHGKWKGDIASNWQTIAEKHNIQDSDGKPFKNTITRTEVDIKIKLLSISISLDSKSQYQNTITLSSLIQKDSHGRFELSYVYRSSVPNPKSSDEQSFLGAGHIIFSDIKPVQMKGLYWTNRKWKEGLNTAGTISLERK